MDQQKTHSYSTPFESEIDPMKLVGPRKEEKLPNPFLQCVLMAIIVFLICAVTRLIYEVIT